MLKNIFLEKNSDGNNNIETLLYDVEKTDYGARNLKPSYFTRSMLEKLDYSGLQDVVDKCVNDLKENHKDILEELLLNALVGGLSNSYSFQEVLKETIHHEILRMNSNQ